MARDQRQTKRQTRKSHRRKSSSGSPSPGTNFYLHVNTNWLTKTHIPPTKSSFGVSEEIEERIDRQTQAILEDCLRSKGGSTTYEGKAKHMIGTLAKSVYSSYHTDVNLTTVRNVLLSIQSLQTKDDVAVVLGEFARYKLPSVFSVYGQYENKNKSHYTCVLGLGSVGLPDPSFYFKQSYRRASFLKGYKHMIQSLEKKFHIPGLSCTIRLERILAAVLWNARGDTLDVLMKGSEIAKEFAHVPWDSFFASLGLSSWRQETFAIESKRWIHTLNKMFDHVGLDYWKLLLSLEFLLFSLPWLPSQYSHLSFDLYRKLIRGQEKPVSKTKKALYIVQQFASPLFSQLYVKELVPKFLKPSATHLLKQLLEFADKRMDALDWLDQGTRDKAQEKIRNMRVSVAYPDSFEALPIPSLHEDALLANLLALGEWETDLEFKKLGQPLSARKSWDDPSFIVNAYYYGQANEIVLPAGILQAPFFDESASLGWNYGGIGCIIAHELTHAFDKEGKEYDPDGIQRRWWTAQDNRNYNEKTKALIKLYGSQKVYGFPVSGTRTLSENIADIGGMGIALDALNHVLDGMKLTKEDRMKEYRNFFTSYATSWRVKERKRKQIQSLITDKHAPAFLRVNLVISQFQEWYDAFDIQSDDPLYLPPEKRIQIF
jgi:putative endopeptidase